MAWNHDISSCGGNELQEMIRESDCTGESIARILEQVQKCCREAVRVLEAAGEGEDASRFDDLCNLLDGEAELCRKQDTAAISEWGFGSFEELADHRLGEFYDCCDDSRIWLGVGYPQQTAAQEVKV